MATRYWGPGGNGLWSDTSNWSSFSTGTPTGASVPTSIDLVVFNASSGSGTATIDTNFTIQSLTMTGFTGTLAFGTNTLTLTRSGAVFTGATTYSVTGTPVINIDNNSSLAATLVVGNTTEANSVSFNIISGTYALTLSSGNYKNLNFTGFAGSLGSTGANNIYGNLTLSSTGAFSRNGSFSFVATSGVQTITSVGATLDVPININCGISTTVRVSDALTMGTTRSITHTNGIFDLNGKTVTLGTTTGAYVTAVGTKVLTFNGGTLVVPGTNTTAFNNTNPTNFSTVAGTGTGKISMTGATAKTFVGGGSTYNCTLSNDGAGALTITGANTFTTLANAAAPTTFSFTAGTTTTVTNFNLAGVFGGLVTIQSATAAVHTLSKASGTVIGRYLSITNSTATGGATWYADINSTNGGGNTGWIFGTSKYWVGGTGNWSNPARWSLTPNGAGGAGITPVDFAFFVFSSGVGTSTVDTNVSIQSLNMSTYAGTLAFGTNSITLTNADGGNTFIGDTTYSVAGTPVINVTSSTTTAITISTGAMTESNSISFNFTTGSYPLTISAGSVFRNLDFTGYSGTVASTGLSLYGDINLGSTVVFAATGTAWTFASTAVGTPRTITSNGRLINFPVTFNGVNGSWKLLDAMTISVSRALTHTNGTVDLNGKTLTAGLRYATAAGTKVLTFNGGELNCSVSSTTSFNNAAPTGFSTVAGTGTGKINMSASGTKTFVGGGSTFNCTVSNGGAGLLTISGNNTIDTVTTTSGSVAITGNNTITTISNSVQPVTFTFTVSTTQTITNWNVNGTAGNLVTIVSSVAGTPASLSKSSGTVSADYLSIKDSTATGGAAWYAGANSTNVSGNSGWIFTAAPTSTGNFFLLF